MHPSRHPTPAAITVRNLDPALKERLRIRAAKHDQSIEAEARHILQTALTPQETRPRATSTIGFAPLGGVDLELRSANRPDPTAFYGKA